LSHPTERATALALLKLGQKPGGIGEQLNCMKKKILLPTSLPLQTLWLKVSSTPSAQMAFDHLHAR
jgi:hypothetical protein